MDTDTRSAIARQFLRGGKEIAINDDGMAEVNGTKLYYEVKGKGDDLVLLHDGLLDSRIWDDQLGSFVRHFKVILYDRRGYGRSEIPKERFSDVQDLYSLLKFLGVEGAYLLGSSNGGGVALDFALEHPEMVNALILAGPSLSGYHFSEERRQKISRILSVAQEGPISCAVRELLDDPHWAPAIKNTSARDKVRLMLEEELLRLRSVGPIGNLVVLPEPPAIRRLSEVRAPTLVVIGERDDTDNHATAGLLEEHFAGARKVVVGGAGHMVNIEKPEDLNRLVLNFLSKGSQLREAGA